MLAYISPSHSSTSSPVGSNTPATLSPGSRSPAHNLQPLPRSAIHQYSSHIMSTSKTTSGNASPSSLPIGKSLPYTLLPGTRKTNTPIIHPSSHTTSDRGSLSAPPSQCPSPKISANKGEAPTNNRSAPSPTPLNLNERLLTIRQTWNPYRNVPSGSPASSFGQTSRADSSAGGANGPKMTDGGGSGGFGEMESTGMEGAVLEPRVKRSLNLEEAMSDFIEILMGDSSESSGSSEDGGGDSRGREEEMRRKEGEEEGGFEMDEERETEVRGRNSAASKTTGEEADGLEEQGATGDEMRHKFAEKYRREPHRAIAAPRSTSVSPISKPRNSLGAVPRAQTKDSSPYNPSPSTPLGWSKGLATLSSHFSFTVDIPVWSPDTQTDLSSLLHIRDQTLKALHNIIDGLRNRGVRATYRLMSISSDGSDSIDGSEEAPYGCIRIAPFLVPTISKSMHLSTPPSAGNGSGNGGMTLVGGPASGMSPGMSVSPVSPSSLFQIRRSTVGPSTDQSNQTRPDPHHSSTMFSTSSPVSTTSADSTQQGLSMSGPSTGKSLHDNEGGCGRLSALPGQATVDQGDEDKELIKKEVQAAIERDRNGIPMEGRTFLLAIHGQPALIIT